MNNIEKNIIRKALCITLNNSKIINMIYKM